MRRTGNRIRRDDAKDVFDTFIRITNSLAELEKRYLKIIWSLYIRNAEILNVARQNHLTERRIRQIRNDALKLLTPILKKEGLFFESRYEQSVPLQEK